MVPIGSAAAAPRLRSVDHAAYEGRLADMLKVVGQHADQPYSECHRRIPCRVDDPVEIGVGETAYVVDRPLVGGVVVAGQQFVGLDSDRGDLVGGVGIAGRE